MKKVITYLCVFAMLFQLLPICATVANAQSENVVTVASVYANSGEKSVKVDLSLENATGLLGMILKISYPKDITLSNVETGSALSTLTLAEFAKPYLNPLVASWDGLTTDNSSGVILSLYFDIPDTAAAGQNYPITVTFDSEDIYTDDGKGDFIDVPTRVVNGSVTVKVPKCEHTLNLVAKKPATCTADGTKAYYVCSKCSAKFWDAAGENPVADDAELVIPATGHVWDAGTVTNEATCAAAGTKHFTCTNDGCTATKDESYSVEDGTHTYTTTSWQFRDGDFDSHYQPCDCGAAAGEKKEAHDWKVDEARYTAATCTEDGTTYSICSICNGEKSETIPATGHAWDAGIVTTEATCAAAGTKHFTCTNDGCTATKDAPYSVEPGTHTYTKTKWLSRDGDAENHYQSCDCGEAERKEAHTWDEGKITTPATHENVGVKTYTCTVCNATKTEDVPKLTEHSYGDWSKLDDEYHHRTCVCSDEQKEAHKWDDGVVTVEPTVDKDGTRTLTCTVCGAKKDVVEPYHVHDYDKDFDDVKWSANASYHWKKCACGEIAYKSAHVSSDWIVDGYPNPVSIGMMHKECVICGYTLAREILPATGGVTRPAQTRQYTVTATAGDHGSISHAGKTVVKSGDNVTYVITPDEGYEIASVLVNGADIGAVREYTFWNVKSDCTISVSFREIPAAHYNPFVDVNPGDAYYDAVLYVYENGLFKGVSETEFAPDTTMTRAMFVTVLGRMAGVNPLLYQKSSFTDVEVGQWYSPYVEWAAQSGIVLGYGDGTFGLNDEITVEQAAVILARYAAFTGRSTYTLRTLSDFADSADVSDWAVYSMKWIVSSGIYTGENGMLSPKSLAKRSLVAAMLYNYAD